MRPSNASFAAACWPTGRLSRTTHNLRNTPERVTIIRPHHPLRGKSFEVVRGGNDRIAIGLSDGSSMYVPRSWTDADGIEPKGARVREEFFTIDSLRRLVALVEALLSRDESSRS
jgi:hypothetical protein